MNNSGPREKGQGKGVAHADIILQLYSRASCIAAGMRGETGEVIKRLPLGDQFQVQADLSFFPPHSGCYFKHPRSLGRFTFSGAKKIVPLTKRAVIKLCPPMASRGSFEASTFGRFLPTQVPTRRGPRASPPASAPSELSSL